LRREGNNESEGRKKPPPPLRRRGALSFQNAERGRAGRTVLLTKTASSIRVVAWEGPTEFHKRGEGGKTLRANFTRGKTRRALSTTWLDRLHRLAKFPWKNFA